MWWDIKPSDIPVLHSSLDQSFSMYGLKKMWVCQNKHLGGGIIEYKRIESIRECHMWEEQGSFCESFFSVVCVCGPRCDVKWIILGCDENILKITGLDPSIFTSVKKKLKHCFKLTLTLSEKYLSNRPGQLSSPKLSHFSFLPKELGKVSRPIL